MAIDVKVFGFLTIPEDAKIGVSAHEIGHLCKIQSPSTVCLSADPSAIVFGWPDLYDTDGTSKGIGNWCLMSFGTWGGGGNRPVHPSACPSCPSIFLIFADYLKGARQIKVGLTWSTKPKTTRSSSRTYNQAVKPIGSGRMVTLLAQNTS